MTQADSLAIQIDLRNPAEFFACCGILEVAHRVDCGTVGCFQRDDKADQFHLSNRGTPVHVRDILRRLLDVPEFKAMLNTSTNARGKLDEKREAETETERANESANDKPEKTAPVELTGNLQLRLDWWTDERGKATPYKLWAGQQSSLSILQYLVPEASKSLEEEGTDPLRQRVPLSGRFGFDPTAAWVALDVGWSPNEQRTEVGTAPALELLGAIGLQRFRPRSAPDARFEYLYTAWGVPLPPTVAQAVCGGACPTPGQRTFRFAIVKRGSYKGFERATEMETTR